MSAVSYSMIDSLFEGSSSAIAKDLKLNLKRVIEESSLSPEEAMAALLAVSTSLEYSELASYAEEQLRALGLPSDQIKEAAESAAIVGMLNVYYRFRHMVGGGDEYRIAALRMTSLAKPVLGKERFEMLSFAVSVINGCESCIKAHEKVLREASVPTDKIHDLARLAAVVKAVKTLRQS